MVVARLLEHEMHMTRAHRVSIQDLKKLADGSVVRDRVGDGHDGLEPEVALVVAVQHCPSVRSVTLRVLDVIKSVRVGLPHVDLDAGDGVSLSVFDAADDQTPLPLRVVMDQFSMFHVFRFMRVKGPQHGAFGRLRWFRMVDRVHQKREPEHIGQKNEFLFPLH